MYIVGPITVKMVLCFDTSLFYYSEFVAVYDTVISGKDALKEMPPRTHLRRSIKEEREDLEKKSKQRKRSLVPVKPMKKKEF